MKTKSFIDANGLELIVKHRKSAVILEMKTEQLPKKCAVEFKYETNEFAMLSDYIESVSLESWPELRPKEADSLGSDYYEYYDKEFDNNGYLSIKGTTLKLDRPVPETNKLYQFNKRKMESFLFDVKNLKWWN